MVGAKHLLQLLLEAVCKADIQGLPLWSARCRCWGKVWLISRPFQHQYLPNSPAKYRIVLSFRRKTNSWQ